MTQVCNACGVEKAISDFEHQKNRPRPLRTCKKCNYLRARSKRDSEQYKARLRAYAKKRRQDNPTAARQRWERNMYGACKEDLGPQECRICGATDKLHIDHCHETGKVRGLLCRNCNIGLGHFKDNPDLLRKATTYLSKESTDGKT